MTESDVLNPRKIEIEDTIRGPRSVKIEGMTFYWLTCLKFVGRAFHRCQMNSVFVFQCKCGNKVLDFAKDVRGGRRKSCGCHMPQRKPKRNPYPDPRKAPGGRKTAKVYHDFWKRKY